MFCFLFDAQAVLATFCILSAPFVKPVGHKTSCTHVKQTANVNFEPIFDENVNFGPMFQKMQTLVLFFVKSVRFQHSVNSR